MNHSLPALHRLPLFGGILVGEVLFKEEADGGRRFALIGGGGSIDAIPKVFR